MVLLLELVDEVLEVDQNWSDVFQVVLLKSLELLDCAEQLLELGDTAAEKVELSKNLIGAEVELFGLGDILKTFLSKFVLLDICFVEIKASLQGDNQLIWGELIMVPQNSVINRDSLLSGGSGA